MVILLFGINNVGKSTIGAALAEKMGIAFYDLDEVVAQQFETTKEAFFKEHPFLLKRSKICGRVLSRLVKEQVADAVIAVCPLHYARDFHGIIALPEVLAIDLKDTKYNIHNRTEYPPDSEEEVDERYLDFKVKRQLRDIAVDIKNFERLYQRITLKYFINNKPVNEVVEALMPIIEANRP